MLFSAHVSFFCMFPALTISCARVRKSHSVKREMKSQGPNSAELLFLESTFLSIFIVSQVHITLFTSNYISVERILRSLPHFIISCARVHVCARVTVRQCMRVMHCLSPSHMPVPLIPFLSFSWMFSPVST